MEQSTKAQLLLQLPDEFDHDALDLAYRSAAAALRGVPINQQETTLRALNEARDRLQSALGPRPSQALVPRTVVSIAPIRPLPRGELERRIEASDRTVKAAVTQCVGRLAAVRQQRFTVALLMGGLAAAGALVRFTVNFVPESGSVALREVFAWGSGVAALVGGIFGALGWAVKGREQWLTLQIEGVVNALTDRATLADTIDEIGAGSDWTRQEFGAAVKAWIDRQSELSLAPPASPSVARDVLRPYTWAFRAVGLLAPTDTEVEMWRVAARLGPNDFVGIVLAKGVETGIVEEAMIRDGSGSERHGYRRLPIV
jgi:hypothetical protein